MAKAAKFQEDKILKKPRAFVLSCQVLLFGDNISNRRAMPLSLSNGLPTAEFLIMMHTKSHVDFTLKAVTL